MSDKATQDRPARNIALFGDALDDAFALSTLAPWRDTGGFVLMGDADFLPALSDVERAALLSMLPTSPDISNESVLAAFEDFALTHPDARCLVVDMGWALDIVWAASLIERWGAIVQSFAESADLTVISVYARDLIVEDQLAAAMRVHQHIAAPSGIYPNPHWMPRDLVAHGSLQQQLSFLLGQIVPEFQDADFYVKTLPDAARGATPAWAQRTRQGVTPRAADNRWHVHCLGPMRVFVGGNHPVNWAIPGSAPKKSRALFAYLLNKGDSGAHIDLLSEFLWPDDAPEETKRGRLRHTLAMLRKSLGGQDTVVRNGDYYRLNIPQSSWIDIRAFEQMCRRGISLFKHGDYADAIRVYEAAERLYGGDLFDDLPHEYAEYEFDDWCLPKRVWLRDMAVKLQCDFATALSNLGRSREALEHSTKALQIDPLHEAANIQMMSTLASLGRNEAVTRQYQQYLKAMGTDFEPSDEVRNVYEDLLAKRSA